jgi:dihydroflavonol-4-reductase
VKVLVTGATGFVGSHSAAALVDAGHEVRLLVRDPAKVATVGALRGRDVETVLGDVVDAESVRVAAAGCDAALHAAAMVALDARRAEQTHRVNVEGTKHVVQAALDAGAQRVLYVSTVALFGFGADRLVTVDSPLASASGPYARSKLEAEQWVREQQDAGAPVVTVYPGGVHGPDVPVVTEGHRATEIWLRMPPKTSSGTSVVDVRDLARVNTALLTDDDPPARLMMGGHFLTWDELNDVLAQVTGRTAMRVPMPAPALLLTGRIGDLFTRFTGIETIWTLESMQSATMAPRYDSTPAIERFGDDVFRPAAATFTDEIRWMAVAGHLSRRLAGTLASDHRRVPRQ